MNQLFTIIPFAFLFPFLLHPTSAQTPAAAPGPAPSGPPDLTAILAKAGHFTTFIRLLKSTKVADQIHTQLNDSNQALTVFAPTDAAFSDLKSGALNSLSDDRKMELIQFHVVPALLAPSQFDTVSNPLRTQAGGAQELFAMNVTAAAGSGGGANITTGYTNASVGSAVYAGDQLAVYEVGKVLLPRRFFEALPPSPPPPPPPRKALPPRAPPAADVAVASSSWEIRGWETVARAAACAVLVAAASSFRVV
ncbi:FASCICLIN-like arabinogalactan-protein 11 [Striga asiatica]|uniref:FASCICLIN-like arabinogalactan-protein 11 n=1 Tax=Striga asiatica TaxID=4170 RepID=A0A5A7QTC6_STRAF|nr:FASCICLIN-like arabinogalactan-protein 11 [Striga asiatica]